jgi:hypothetical protein
VVYVVPLGPQEEEALAKRLKLAFKAAKVAAAKKKEQRAK